MDTAILKYLISICYDCKPVDMSVWFIRLAIREVLKLVLPNFGKCPNPLGTCPTAKVGHLIQNFQFFVINYIYNSENQKSINYSQF